MEEFFDWLSTLPTTVAVVIVLLILGGLFATIQFWAWRTKTAKKVQLKEELKYGDAKFRQTEVKLKQAIESGNTTAMIQLAKQLVDCAASAGRSAQSVAQKIYNESLALIEKDGKQKRFALEIGRLSYGLSRPDGSPTVYDEQAIKHDVDARLP